MTVDIVIQHSNPEEMVSVYPRILVFSPEPFNLERGCGITLTNLFAGWPVASLACLYLSEWVKPDTSVCPHHLGLTQYCDSSLKTKVTVAPSRDSESKPSKNRIWSLLSTLDKKLGIWQWRVLSRNLPPSAVQWIVDFSPQVIYCPINSPTILCLFKKLVAVTRVPSVVHVYDDWIAIVGENGSLTGRVFGMILENKLQRALVAAAGRMTIGEEMGRQYCRRYGVPFLSFQNPPSAGVWLAYGRNNWTAGVPFRFRFFGNIYPDGNLDSLRRFAEILEYVVVSGCHALFEVYTTQEAMNQYCSLFADNAHTVFYPVVQKDEDMALLYGTADSLVLAYNTDRLGRRAFGLSMPTKLPTYLLSGTPMVVYAPADSAVTRLIREEDCGFYLAPEESKELGANRLVAFISNEAGRENWAKRGRAVAHRFTADIVRPAFQNALIQAVEHSSGKPHER